MRDKELEIERQRAGWLIVSDPSPLTECFENHYGADSYEEWCYFECRRRNGEHQVMYNDDETMCWVEKKLKVSCPECGQVGFHKMSCGSK